MNKKMEKTTRWDNRFLAIPAFALLVSCVVFIIFDKENWANHLAVYIYYFLILLVVLQLIEYKIKPKLYHETKDKK